MKAAVVVNKVTVGAGFERHGQASGNVVQLDNGRYVRVTEPGMIRHA